MSSRDIIFAAAGGSPSTPDPYFENVTLLLDGNGTNGGQNNTFLDSSTNNFTITRNGNTTQGSFSPYGTNWSLSGNNAGGLTAPNNSAFAFGTGDFTMECFYQNPSPGPAPNIIGTEWFGSNITGKWMFLVSNTVSGEISVQVITNSGGTQAVLITSGATNANDGQWHHIAVTRSGTTMRAFLDGVIVATSTSSFNFQMPNSTLLYIGQYYNPGDGARTYNTGFLSNVRVVKGTALYTAAFTPPTSNLTAVSGTSLLTCQNNRFIDNSTNNFAISTTGTPQVSRFSPFQPTATYSTSVIGGSGYFDGTTSNLITSTAVGTIGTGDFSFEAWVYATSAAGYACIVGNDGSGKNVFLEFGTARGFWFGGPEMSGGAIRYNQWVHLAVCRTSGTASMYLNGIRTNTTSWTTNLSSAIEIGINNYVTNSTSGFGITGYIASPRVFIGTSAYNAASTTITIPTTPPAPTGATYLPAMINAAIPDYAMMNNLETLGNAQVSTSVKKFGTGSIAFDGTGDYLKTSPNPALNFSTGNFTVEFWIYTISTSSTFPFSQTNIAAGRNGVAVGWQSSTNFWWLFGNGSNWVFERTPASTVPTNTWFHVAVVRDNGTARFYVGGVQIDSIANTTNLTQTSNISFLGGSPDGYVLNGYMDDIRVTNGICRYPNGTTFTPPTKAFPTF